MGDFEVHKLTIETLGEYLTAVRNEAGKTEQEVVRSTGIAPKVLAALESARFDLLPEPVYVVGFIRKLAMFYEVPSQPLILQFHRELVIAQQQVSRASQSSWRVLAQRLAPIRWTFGLSVLGISLFIGLCVWQVFAIGTVPQLTVTSPVSGQKLTSGMVVVSGLATPGSEVALNGQVVYAGADGTFSSSISLLPGAQNIVVSAKSRFNKVATRTISLMVEQSATGMRPGFVPSSDTTSAVHFASGFKTNEK